MKNIQGDMVKYLECPYCLSKDIYEWNQKSFSYTQNGCSDLFSVFKCNFCGSGFLNPPPTKEYLSNIYKYSGHALSKPISLDEIIRKEKEFPNTTVDARRIVDVSDSLNSLPSRNALDIGSGYGFITKELNGLGYSVTSVNPGEYENNVFRYLNGYDPIIGFFEDISFEKKYSLVLISQVLEHMIYPNDVLKKVSDVMEVNGVLAIAVPNFNSFSVKMRGINDNSCLWIPEHVNYFTVEGLKQLLSRHGYKIVSHNFVSRYPYNRLSNFFNIQNSDIRYVFNAVIKYLQLPVSFILNSFGMGIYINVYAVKE